MVRENKLETESFSEKRDALEKGTPFYSYGSLYGSYITLYGSMVTFYGSHIKLIMVFYKEGINKPKKENY